MTDILKRIDTAVNRIRLQGRQVRHIALNVADQELFEAAAKELVADVGEGPGTGETHYKGMLVKFILSESRVVMESIVPSYEPI